MANPPKPSDAPEDPRNNLPSLDSLIYYLPTLSLPILELRVCNEPQKKKQAEEEDEKNRSKEIEREILSGLWRREREKRSAIFLLKLINIKRNKKGQAWYENSLFFKVIIILF